MKSMYKITLLLFFIPMLIFSSVDEKKHEKTRKIKKEFSVSNDAKLKINNKYGNVTITSWNEKKIAIEVVITIKGNDLERVEKQLESINVEFSASSDLVSAKTTFEKGQNNWSWWKKNDNLNYKIDYFIKMPKTNSTDLVNEYGNIFIDVLVGNTSIKCNYGKIEIGELLGDSNYINLNYCSSSSIGFVKNGNFNLDYSKLSVENSENIKAHSDYTTLNINKVKDIDFNAGYGSIRIDDAQNVIGNSDYTSLRFGNIRKSLTVKTDYGSVFVKHLEKEFEVVDINGEFATIKIEVAPEAIFNFTLDLQYAGFTKNTNKIEFFTQIEKSNKKFYEGKFGKGNTTSKLVIKSQYGSVSLSE